MSNNYSYELHDQHVPLPKLVITPKFSFVNWESSVIQLQNLYLKVRTDSNPKSIGETIELLAHLGYSNKLLETSELEYYRALAWHSIGQQNIYKLFQDDEVTEAFCNDLDSAIVISHRTYGRCLTNLFFDTGMWEALRIRCEYDSKEPLSPLSPSLKYSLATHFGNLRISIQIPPLTPGSPSFNIRRLPKKPISLDSLVKTDQISSKNAEYLISYIKERLTIIIAGEPGSGKTTLANALLMHSAPDWRLIIMEDSREVIIPSDKFPMSTRYFMPSVGTTNHYDTRSNEIARLLHRSPDYVFLGELQNRDDTRVAFEGFSAGLRGMATTHARDLDGLLKRWHHSHQIDEALLSTIDVIVITKREIENGRMKLSVGPLFIQKNGQFTEVGH
ncbi:MAG: type II/IV secretion system ATPase subunit [Candidatus Heimdallarchaeota archaeon]|nr:type II/IV secretion system ATPase subunit [Candidatus Heimdallarchaeota archaeon]